MLFINLLPNIGNPINDKTTKRANAIEQKRRVLSVAARAELIWFGVKDLYFCVWDSTRLSVAKVETDELRSVDETKDEFNKLPSGAGLLVGS